MKNLTPKQLETLNAIRLWCGYNDMVGPSITDIMRIRGVNSSAGIREHVEILAAAGYITREPGKWRSIRLTKKGKA